MKVKALLCALLLLGSCGKKSDSKSPEATLPAPETAVAPTTADVAAAPAEADFTKTLDRLTQAVRRYAAETRSVPKSLNELVTAGYLPELPAAPPGKHFFIDDQLRVRVK